MKIKGQIKGHTVCLQKCGWISRKPDVKEPSALQQGSVSRLVLVPLMEICVHYLLMINPLKVVQGRASSRASGHLSY
jgi:hypothetical protein